MDGWRRGVGALDMGVLQEAKRMKKRETGNHRRILPLNITIEILCFLPTKTLVRFRRVCKLWHSITHDPHFIKTHLHFHKIHSSSLPIIFLIPFLDPDFTFTLTRPDCCDDPKSVIPRDVILYASCNGLLCLSDHRTATTFVVNPVTGESLTLPPSAHMELVITSYFGFEPTTKEYKVLRTFTGDKDALVCEVFTLDTDSSWRQIHASLDIDTFEDDGITLKGIALNGAIYWHACLCKWLGQDGQALRFDLKYECFDQITLSCFQNLYRKTSYLVGEDFAEQQGSLCLPIFPNVTMSDSGIRPRMDIWVMTTSSNNVKQEWSIKYSIMFPWDRWSEPTPLFIRNDKIWVFDYSLNGNRLQYNHLHTNNNHSNGNYKQFYHHQDEDSCMVQFVHVESLVPLHICLNFNINI